MRLSSKCLGCLAAVILAGMLGVRARSGPRMEIRHRGFEQFRQGSFGDGGTNIYVSKNGVIQLIPRWDLNRDGYLDLLMPQDHSHIENVDAFIYWNTGEGFESLAPAFSQELPLFKLFKAFEQSKRKITFLPTSGGGPVKVADLNRDGYPDIVFANTIHNYTVHMQAYIYWGGPEGYSLRHRAELPTLFAEDLAVADFNRDGYLDLAFANFGNEVGDRWGYMNHLESYIYWGSPEGFSVGRRTSIPTMSAVSCGAGDFNGDGWVDLAFANNNLQQRSVYVYLGGSEGFGTQRRLELKGGNPGRVRAADLNKDRIDDLIVSSREKGTAIHYGFANFRLDQPAQLPTDHAKNVAAGDFNRDGHMDLVFASGSAEAKSAETQSELYWGSATGFDSGRKMLLPTKSPRAVAVGDLNGDGFPEIVFANAREGNNSDVVSYIYWNSQGSFDPSRQTQLQGFGPVGVAIADLDRNGRPDILLVNQLSGKSAIPSVIFWGNAAHMYSQANATLLPSYGPNFCTVADLNDDGYPDIVFTGIPVVIYWGSAEGFRASTELDLGSNVYPIGVAVGDFNRDGYLDLVLLLFSWDARGKSYGVVLWGTENGFSMQHRTEIRLKADRSCCGVTAADLNKDGFVDLVFPAGESKSRLSEIVWGGPQGFDKTPPLLLSTNGVDAPAVADLDGNGWLDLIFPGTQNMDTQDPHTKTLIYWGSERGFSDNRRTGLEAYQSLEAVVVDLNRDGHLDIVVGNYKAEHTRTLPIFIFWGNARHAYSDRTRSELPAESSCGIQVLDLNEDGFPEIVVHNHVKDGDHNFGSYIYWGGPDGYSIERRTHLPTMGTHYARTVDPGNIYDRSPGTDYESPPISLPGGVSRLRLDWKGESPHHTSIRFEVRTATEATALASSAWRPIDTRQDFPLPNDAKFLQYRAILVSSDGGNSPLLREIDLLLE